MLADNIYFAEPMPVTALDSVIKVPWFTGRWCWGCFMGPGTEEEHLLGWIIIFDWYKYV